MSHLVVQLDLVGFIPATPEEIDGALEELVHVWLAGDAAGVEREAERLRLSILEDGRGSERQRELACFLLDRVDRFRTLRGGAP